MEIRTEKLSYDIASAILVHYGEISVEEIRAIPFLKEPKEAENIINLLLESFNAEIYVKKVLSKYIPEWEEIIRLIE